MDFSTLAPVEDFPVHFFDDTCAISYERESNCYKIYHDGGHYVGTLYKARNGRKDYTDKKRVKQDIDILFDGLFFDARKMGLRNGKMQKPMTEHIKAGLLKLFDDTPEMDEYIEKGIKRRLNNILHRKKRFRRKGFLNKWTHFVTVTYFYGHNSDNRLGQRNNHIIFNLKEKIIT